MTYAEQLRDPRWKRKRAEILKRDNNSCLCCETRLKLHVHHTIYFKGKMAWDYADHFLMTLCSECHGNIEEDIAQIKNALSILQLQDPTEMHRLVALITRRFNSKSRRLYNDIRYGRK